MLELNPFRKNKINLQDYDYQKDIQNRLIMATLTIDDIRVLEELLCGHLKISISELAQDLIMEELTLVEILKKLSSTQLFYTKDHHIFLNKDVRKYFEFQLQKFEDGFVPGMEYLQALLRKVPFHILLSWYPIPRTANNIFDAIVEKYLLTPQIFQRYLMELNFGNSKIGNIVKDVYQSEDFVVSGSDIKKRHQLSDEEFEEILLHLEFNFVCCLTYQKVNNCWEQMVTPFYEWREYLRFLRDHKPTAISDSSRIQRYRNSDFAFIEDMTEVLNLVRKKPLSLYLDSQERWVPDKVSFNILSKKIPLFEEDSSNEMLIGYLSKIFYKLIFLKLCTVESSSLIPHEGIDEWLALSVENKALTLYKHTVLRLQEDFPVEFSIERTIREIEKSMIPIAHIGWIAFEDFIKCISTPIGKDAKILLKKTGRLWKYTLPSYTDVEYNLIKKSILEWLFEAGFVAIGSQDNTIYFRMTAFGVSIFS